MILHLYFLLKLCSTLRRQISLSPIDKSFGIFTRICTEQGQGQLYSTAKQIFDRWKIFRSTVKSAFLVCKAIALIKIVSKSLNRWTMNDWQFFSTACAWLLHRFFTDVTWFQSRMSNINNNSSASAPSAATAAGNITGHKRKSRFDTDVVDPVLPEQKRLNLEVSQAAAKAAEISKEIAAKVSGVLYYRCFCLFSCSNSLY